MHFANGNPARVGDLVITAKPQSGQRTLGILLQITPGATSCNGQVAPLARMYADGAWRQVPLSPYMDCVTIRELLPAIPGEGGKIIHLENGEQIPVPASP